MPRYFFHYQPRRAPWLVPGNNQLPWTETVVHFKAADPEDAIARIEHPSDARLVEVSESAS